MQCEYKISIPNRIPRSPRLLVYSVRTMTKPVLRVGLSILPPFIEKNGNHFTGFEFELWEKMARIMQVDCEYSVHSLKGLITNIQNKNVDLAIAGISKTERREKIADFTYSTYKSGLHILLPSW